MRRFEQVGEQLAEIRTESISLGAQDATTAALADIAAARTASIPADNVNVTRTVRRPLRSARPAARLNE